MLSKHKKQFYQVVKLVSLSVILLGLLSAVAVPHQEIAAETSATNIILFIGDGMGMEHIKAGGLFANGTLSFESFTYMTTMTHNNVRDEVTDSAAGATAIATGVKVPNRVISQGQDGAPLTTLLELHKAKGKRTGLVTTSYMTDATVAAFGAHETLRGDRDKIAADYFRDDSEDTEDKGSRPNVLFGGGGAYFTESAASSAGYSTVGNRDELERIDTEAETRIAGVFGSGEIPPDGMPDRSSTLPTLPEMTEAALNILDNGSEGLFLVVEHEGSDTYSHGGYGQMDYDTRTGGMARSVAELSTAVEKAMEWKEGNPNTIILVTADHETGGLTVPDQDSSANTIPSVSWGRYFHSDSAVPVYVDGVDYLDQESKMQITNGEEIKNTDIFKWLKPAADATPWQAAAGSPTKVNVSSSYYSAGYHFTPLTNGNVTALGGYFNGTKPVRLFNKTTGELLAETMVTGNNDWSYGAIPPVLVTKDVEYTVAVHLAGSGGSYERSVDFPITSGGIQINASTFAGSESDPDARPTNDFTYNMIGQADIAFAPSDGSIPDTPTPVYTPTPTKTPRPTNTPRPTPTPSSDIATMISPVPDSTLPGSEVTFTWTDVNRRYYLRVSSENGQHYSESQGSNTSATVTGLPTDGSTINVLLWTSTETGGWKLRSYQYTASDSDGGSIDGDTPWQAAAGSPTRINLSTSFAADGYHFTPLTDGDVTALGGYFNGTKTVRLFNTETAALLAETTVTSNNSWSYTAISPVFVEEGVQYTVAVYLAGSGRSYQRNVNMPITSGNIQIDASTYGGTEAQPPIPPIYSQTSTMYGQADIAFAPSQ